VHREILAREVIHVKSRGLFLSVLIVTSALLGLLALQAAKAREVVTTNPRS
jgi:hypothetical protein